jgi:hypothetical protein
MLAPLLVFGSIVCVGLLAALRPQVFARYFLTESQQRALSGNLSVISMTGWAMFSGCIAIIIVILFRALK